MSGIRTATILLCTSWVACTNSRQVTPTSHPDSGPSTVLPIPPPPPLPPPPPTPLPDAAWGTIDLHRPGSIRPQGPIVSENALPGTSKWSELRHKANHGEIEGYADRVSAQAGDTVNLMVNADLSHMFSWNLFRIGWYGGTGGREIASGGPLPVAPQSTCPISSDTGLIRCAWTPTFQFVVSDDLVSGLYLFKLVRDDDLSSWIPLVIRDDRHADLLFQSSVLTAQAYNNWHGESLYNNDNRSIVSLMHGAEVSFDRPYVEGVGAGEMIQYEMYMAQFLEHFGYDVTYTTNLDVAGQGLSLIRKSRAFLSVGHDEYWPKAERGALESARDLGTPLLFWGANTGYWQVRLADDPGTGVGPRDVIGWKEMWQQDPDQGPEVTAQYRNPVINRPENGLVGVMYNSWMNVRAPLTVAHGSNWLFDGTGLQTGDTIPFLIGYEGDGRSDNGFEPAGLQVAAQIPVVSVDGTVEVASTVSYRATSGALVFATGSIEWSWGLGYPGVADPRVERMTANVLKEALGLHVPDGVGSASLPSPVITGPFATSVSTIASGLDGIMSVVEQSDGSLLAADTIHNQILTIGPAPDRTISILAGTGVPGNDGWDSQTPGAQVQFSRPTALLFDSDGQLLVADTGNHCLRKILNDPAHSVITLAGTCGEPGVFDATGTSAQFFDPMGLAIDPVSGDILVADTWNGRIRAVAHGTWDTRTVVGFSTGDVDGPAAQARLDFPTAIAADPSGNLYILESGSQRLVRMGTDSDQTVTTIAGGQECGNDGSGDEACFGAQLGLVWCVDALYLSDGANGRIRRVVPGSSASDTQVTTLAGVGGGEIDGTGAQAMFLMPFGLSANTAGQLLVTDYGSGAIRLVTP